MKLYIKMAKKIIKFRDTEIKKQKIHQHKSPILIINVHFNKVLVSNKVSFGKKGFRYFLSYKDA